MSGYRQKREEDFRIEAELTRMSTTELINIQLDPVKRIKPYQLWRFPWDNEAGDEGLVDKEVADQNLKMLIEAVNNKADGRNSTDIP